MTPRLRTLAGLDEAGYGPLLGPLVVACVEWDRTPQETADPFAATGLRIDDSKKVHASRGLAGLEETILAVLGGDVDRLGGLADRVAPSLDLDGIPWYDGWRDLPLPARGKPGRIADGARAILRAEPPRLHAEILCAKVYNDGIEHFGNKSDLLFDLYARHLRRLHEADDDAQVVCDKLGGRKFYAPGLRRITGADSVEIVREKASESLYRAGRMEICFRQGADGADRCVALASMLAKYLRELLLLLFNDYWVRQVPGVRPTAGYWVDGTRFLKEIETRRAAIGIPDSLLIRSR